VGDPICDVYEKWRNSQSAKHIETALDGEHRLERGYLGDFALDCWAAIKAHAQRQPCMWTLGASLAGNQVWYTSCRHYADLRDIVVREATHCLFCGAPLVLKAVGNAD
jgi:hypothetical protein